MKVYVYPADRFACGLYRLIWPAEALRAQGHDVTVVYADQRDITVAIEGDTIFHVSYPKDADLLVFQRVTHHHLAHAIRWLSERVATVVDIDDDLKAIHPMNPAWAAMHPRNTQAGRQHSWHFLDLACRYATMVTVSSDALLPRYAPHGRGRVIHNHVPADWLNIPHQDSAVIGWPASLHSHPDDPAPARTAISRLVREGETFKIWGPPELCGRAFGLEADPPGTGPIKLENWPNRVAEIGVGISPLKDTRFNRAKSWLKLLEKNAVGVPWVASPRPEYSRLHRLGCGLLADSPKDWYRQLKRMTSSPDLRLELSAAGRHVASHLTIEGNSDLWLDAWTSAIQSWRLDSRPTPVIR